MHNVDSERERTYNLAGSVDAQIKSLAAELREVRDFLNKYFFQDIPYLFKMNLRKRIPNSEFLCKNLNFLIKKIIKIEYLCAFDYFLEHLLFLV